MTASVLANAGLVTCLVFDLLFVIGFLARSQWRTFYGVFILGFATVIELLLGMRLYGRLVVPLPDAFWAVAYWALAVTFGFLLYGLWSSHGRPFLGGVMTRRFLSATVERAVRAMANTMLAALTLNALGAVDVRAIGWADMLSIGAGAALVSVLISLGASQWGDDHESPSFLPGIKR